MTQIAILQEMTNNVEFTRVLVTLHRNLQVVLRKTTRVGDTKYDIYIVMFAQGRFI